MSTSGATNNRIRPYHPPKPDPRLDSERKKYRTGISYPKWPHGTAPLPEKSYMVLVACHKREITISPSTGNIVGHRFDLLLNHYIRELIPKESDKAVSIFTVDDPAGSIFPYVNQTTEEQSLRGLEIVNNRPSTHIIDDVFSQEFLDTHREGYDLAIFPDCDGQWTGSQRLPYDESVPTLYGTHFFDLILKMRTLIAPGGTLVLSKFIQKDRVGAESDLWSFGDEKTTREALENHITETLRAQYERDGFSITLNRDMDIKSTESIDLPSDPTWGDDFKNTPLSTPKRTAKATVVEITRHYLPELRAGFSRVRV
jgi:hypothetical protein